ncbi:MAG: efflux RND transporter periplasmic adaptor subunit [Methylacidiphilales bacterium]|nr:efflux RND transporter periplasmic adaptor subunit [Candidatus Methylacidiphilales bacterium]
MKVHFFTRLAIILLGLAVTGCQQSPPSAAGGPPQPPPAQVSVVTLVQQPVTLTTDLPGRTSPYRIADVRPQVNGVLQKRMFVEGEDVQAGQQLYQIDPAPYQAAYDSAQAMLAHANAEMASAKALLDRYKALGSSNAVSKQDYDNASAAELQAQADIESGQAAVEAAHINLVYTKVLSPITGRTGISVTEGALVTANQTTPLVTVQQLDPIYVDIPQSMALLLRLRRELASGQIKTTGENQAQVTLTLEDGSGYEQSGQLQFAETTVDQSTGSVTMRAIFPNPQRLLLPGMFVTALLQEGVSENAILVPQQGVTHNAQGEPTALVVTPDDKVELRVIKTNRAIRDQWLVTDGLHAGDRVIVDGLQRAHPGATVVPTEVTSTTTAQQP